MFSFREFIRRGFLNAVGKLADYQIILNAAGWYDKGVLLEDDLAEIQSAINARNAGQASNAVASAEDTPAEDAPSGEDTPAQDPPSVEDTPAEDAPD